MLCCAVLFNALLLGLCCSTQAGLVSGQARPLNATACALISAPGVTKHQLSTGVVADVLLDRLEKMRTSTIWAPAFASLPDKPWHGAYSAPGSDHHSEFERLLARALAGQEQTSKKLTSSGAQAASLF